jgi:hypothetical protein
MAQTCGTCGAVSGAILGINLCLGRSEPGGAIDANYAAVQKLLKTFEEQFGSLNCQPLLSGCDLGTEKGQKTFKEDNLFPRCLDYAEAATRLALTIIEEATPES